MKLRLININTNAFNFSSFENNLELYDIIASNTIFL